MSAIPQTEQDPVDPTPERLRRGKVVLADGPIESRRGEFAAPYIVVDLLTELHSVGKISAEERLAGERFRTWFTIAHLDELRAVDLTKPLVDGAHKELRHSVQRNVHTARDEIWRAIRWLDGMLSLQGSCMWHVVGLDESLRSWCRNHTRIPQPGAIAVLICALERLALMPWRGPHE